MSSDATSILIKPLDFLCCPLYVLLSSLPAAIISSSTQHIFLPLIHSTFAIFIPTPPPTPSLSISLLYISIYLSINLSPITHFLSPLSHTRSLSLYIYHQRLSLPASYSLSHYLLLDSTLSHYLTLYLSYTLSLSFMPRNKLDRVAGLLPFSPLLLLWKLGWGG